jgi:NTE family protein
MTDKKIALVLGSGGARGMAHIGIINWLDDNGFRIASVSGASMGALVGGIYAAGKLDEYASWLLALTRADIVKLLDFSFERSGLFKGRRIMQALRDLLGNYRIEDLDVSFTAVATDVETGKEVWINDGPLFDAIRASIAIPMFFTPFEHNGRMLLDGGLLNPVPIAPIFSDAPDIIIAVNLGGDPDPELEQEMQQRKVERNSFEKYHDKILSFIAALQTSGDHPQEKDWDLFDSAFRSFETMQGMIARMKLAAYAPDYVIEIPRNKCASLDFHRARELIDYGRQRAEQELACLLEDD